MRAELSKFSVERPRSLDQALALMAGEERLTPLAGGTDLYVYLNAGIAKPGRWIDVWALDELRGFQETGTHFVFGALTTYTELQKNEQVRARLPLLAQAASTVGAVAIQNRGTLGGNVANASPAGDSLPPLLVYDAEIGLRSAKGQRWVPFRSFYTGYRASVMAADELIESIRVPKDSADAVRFGRFVKIGTRAAQAISKVVAAFALGFDAGGAVTRARIAYGSVAPTPVRLAAVETHLTGRSLDAATIAGALDVLDKSIQPIDDIRSTASYRRYVSKQILERFLEDSSQ